MVAVAMLSPASDLQTNELGFFSDEPLKVDELEESSGLPDTCGICNNSLSNPLILNCLHIFDQGCLVEFENYDGIIEFIKCPTCGRLSGGLKSLEPYDITVVEQNEHTESEDDVIKCSVCTEGKEAQYRCIQCAGTLCDRCRDTHKVCYFTNIHPVRS